MAFPSGGFACSFMLTVLLLLTACSFCPHQITCSYFFYNVAVEYNAHIYAVTFCTFQVGLYIGEICRYIMAVPPKPEDSRHHIRSMIGNGMRATVWKDFIERFKIKEMIEVYGITEGNVTVCKLFYSENYKYETYLNNMLCYSIFWCIILTL
jgi:acyl-CoA synthetase (AMP-forming)/AMP-acid ligase II